MFSMIERWNSEMSCGTTEIASRRLCWVTLRNVLAVDGDAAMLNIVEPLQQRKHAGFAAAGSPDQPDLLPRRDAQAELVENMRRRSG